MLSSNRTVHTVKAPTGRKSRGLLQALALLGMSGAGAFALLGQATPTSNQAAGTGAVVSSSSPQSATSDAISYRFGTVQLKVTETSGKITAIDLVQASATAGRDQAFSYLVTDAISANGSSFSNLSGATFTTDAFKQALDNAIAKLS